MSHKGEVGLTPEEGGGKFVQDPAGSTTSVSSKEYTIRLGHITFDPGVLCTINWRSTGVPCSESNRKLRGEKSSDPRNKTTVSSTTPIPEDY